MFKRFISALICCCVICAHAGAGDQPPAGVTTAAAVSQKVTPDTAMLKLTLTELAKYNGQNGMPAYVAVNDTIYDVSKVKLWANGKHHGHKAGTDVTKEIMKSPHKLSVLKKLKKVGMIVAESKSADTDAAVAKKFSHEITPVK